MKGFWVGLVFVSLAVVATAWSAENKRAQSKKTPLGVYQKQVFDRIGALWYMYVQQKSDHIPVGKVTINFRILATGRVTNLRVVGNTANEALAEISIRAVLQARLPPIPEGVRRQIHQDFIDWDGVNFIIYPN